MKNLNFSSIISSWRRFPKFSPILALMTVTACTIGVQAQSTATNTALVGETTVLAVESEPIEQQMTPSFAPPSLVILEPTAFPFIQTPGAMMTNLPPNQPIPSESFPQNYVDHAIQDLAGRLAIAADQIQVLEVREVLWPNAALGCEQPGMGYKQIPYDGLLIRLEANEREYNFHSGAGKPPFLCEQTSRIFKRTPIEPNIIPIPPEE